MPTYQDFNGTELLEPGFERDIGNILARDELGGISNGYQLDHAPGEKSGYSLGGNQMDLGSHAGEHYFALVKDILINATDENGAPVVPNGAEFADHLHDALTSRGDSDAVSADDRELINAALSSQYGREQIDEAFPGAVHQSIDHVWGVVSALPPGEVKTDLIESAGMQATLADYDNQFHIDPNGAMQQFLEGKAVPFADGSTAQATDGLTQQQLFDFIHHQHEFQQNPTEYDTRYEQNLGPYIEGMTGREINEQVATDRALEALHESIVAPPPLTIHDPWSETAAQQFADAARAEMHESLTLQTPVLDQLNAMFPAPEPPAPPAYLLPELTMPPGYEQFGTPTSAAHDGAGTPHASDIAAGPAYAQSYPPSEPTYVGPDLATVLVYESPPSFAVPAPLDNASAHVVASPEVTTSWLPEPQTFDSRAQFERTVYEPPPAEHSHSLFGAMFGFGAGGSDHGTFATDFSGGSSHPDPAPVFHDTPAAFSDSSSSSHGGSNDSSGSHGGVDAGAGI